MQEILDLSIIKDNGFIVKELKGGLSGTSIYKLESQDRSYVLRLHLDSETTPQDDLEQFCALEGSKKGLSPYIYYVSDDKMSVLMEFINTPTLTLKVAKESVNIKKIADVIKKAHQINGHPTIGESLISKAKRCHEIVLNHGLGPKNEINSALEFIKDKLEELSTYDYEKIHVHGDLNPRNIFVMEDRVLLIDWAETTLEDPFYDLTYFAMKLGYNQNEEMLLLTSYLKRNPTHEELKRFALHKKIHQAFWSLTNLYLADVELKKNPSAKIDKNKELKSWEYYQNLSADCEDLDAQYFYELSRLNYKLSEQM